MTSTETKTFPFWVLVALAVSLLLLLGGDLWLYRTEEAAARQKAAQQLAAIAQLKVDQIVAWRNERLGDAAVLRENPFFIRNVTRFLADPQGLDALEISRYLRSIQAHSHYADILLVDSEGRVRLSLKKHDLHGGFIGALAVALREHTPVFTDLHVEENHPSPHLSVVTPLFSDDKEGALPLGAVVLINDAEQFLYPAIQSWNKPSKTMETLLVRRDGDMALFLNELLHQPQPIPALKLRVPLSQTDTLAVMAIQGRKGFVEGLDYRRIASLAVLLPVPDSSWFLVTKDDTAEILGVWRFRAALLVVLFTVLGGGLGALGLVVWQYNKKAQYQALYTSEARLRASTERHSITLKAVGDGIIATDAQGRVELMNPVAETLTGWKHEDACGRPLSEVFIIVNEETREHVENPVAKTLREGVVVGLSNHTVLISRDGSERAIADSAAPIRDAQDDILGVVLVFRDQTEERWTQRLLQARLILQEYAFAHTLEDLLTKALDEIAILVNSPQGYYHFVAADQEAVTMEQWSTGILHAFPRIERSRGLQRGIDQVKVWAQCVRGGRPVVHNEAVSLPPQQEKIEGLPEEGRHLVVPVKQAGKVVAILGMGKKSGDYTEKDIETVSYLADVTRRLVEQKWAEERLLLSERRYRTLYQSMMDAFVVTDMNGRIRECNTSYCSMLGYTIEELKELRCTDITPARWFDQERRVFNEQVLPLGCSRLYEKEYQRKDGTVFPVELRTFLLLDNNGKPEGLSAIVHDITERRRTEEEQEKLQAQLYHAQKMESVGRLAGGVAHDFNNMLSVILGYAELSLKKIAPSDPLYQDLQAIYSAGRRSADITRQLLAFARKQTIAPRALDLNDTVEGMLKMLRRIIGEDIDLAWLPEVGLWPVHLDPSQMDQLLANLCVNARDAISGQGKITIETKKVTFDRAYCAEHAGFFPGDFVLLAVSDDGCGIDRENMDKVFEPFFTTKEAGKGTGLGLATVYGIVKQNEGFINVYSEPDQGTTFRIYLPRYDGASDECVMEKSVELPLGHGETVLVVEDETAILELSKSMLESLGYVVITADKPSDAVQLAQSYTGTIDLLLIDVIMPEMNGRDLARQLLILRPDIKILFMSGYTANVIVHRGVLDKGVRFIQKPFSAYDLAVGISEALQQEPQIPDTSV